MLRACCQALTARCRLKIPLKTPLKVQSGVLVLGLGNPLCRDDGLGGRVIEMLTEKNLPAQVALIDGGTPGWGVANFLQGWSRVILIDAADMGLLPGTWRRFRMEDVSLGVNSGCISLHEPGLAEGLALGQALGMLPQDIILYCVQPEYTEEGIGLTSVVEAVLPELVENILLDLWNK